MGNQRDPADADWNDVHCDGHMDVICPAAAILGTSQDHTAYGDGVRLLQVFVALSFLLAREDGPCDSLPFEFT